MIFINGEGNIARKPYCDVVFQNSYLSYSLKAKWSRAGCPSLKHAEPNLIKCFKNGTKQSWATLVHEHIDEEAVL